jgi:hypothetical protein
MIIIHCKVEKVFYDLACFILLTKYYFKFLGVYGSVNKNRTISIKADSNNTVTKCFLQLGKRIRN